MHRWSQCLVISFWFTLAVSVSVVGQNSSSEPASAEEVRQLKQQLSESNQRIEKLAVLIQELQAKIVAPSAPQSATSASAPAASEAMAVQGNSPKMASSGLAQPKPSTIDNLIAPKLAGGQFSGSEGLLKTDRLKIGGYMDFRYVTRGLDEGFEVRSSADAENPGRTDVTNFKRNGFIAPRLVLGVAAALTNKLVFNSEIEFEFAGKETEIEQAYLEYRFHPKFNFRGGIVVPPLGRFNLFHDANLQDISIRPLVSTFVIPSTYKDAGVGGLGEFKLGRRARLTYEAYVVNGLRSDEGGEFAREAGIFESKGNNRFFDNNPQKSGVGRLMFSPTLGVELGLSGYRGKHDNQGQYNLSIWALDWKFSRHDFQVLGEFARNAVQRPPESALETAARQFLLSLPRGDYLNTFAFLDTNINEPIFDNPARSAGGIYTEVRYRFHPQWLTSHTSEDASIAPVFRYDQVNFDRQFPNFRFPLNMRRTSFGVSFRPTEPVTFNVIYHISNEPDLFLRLPDGRPFPPYFTNLGANGVTFGMGWAF